MEANDGTRKASWVKSLKVNGKKPILEIIDKIPACDWTEMEGMYIKLFKSMGAKLTNLESGGLRKTCSKESIEKRLKTISTQKQVYTEKRKASVQKNLIDRVRKYGPWNKGLRYTLTLTDAEREAKSKAQIGKHKTKPVIQLDMDGNYIAEWTGAYSAYRSLGISFKDISSNCRGIRKSAGGYKWKFKTE